MGSRGPKPKPTTLRVLHGDRADRINKGEPQPPEKMPACPAALSPEARRIWRHYATQLHKRGLLTTWDRDTFGVLCETIVTWRRAKEMVDQAIVVNRGGKLVKTPAWQIYREAAVLLRGYAQDFGLNPSARSGISLPSGYDDAELNSILS